MMQASLFPELATEGPPTSVAGLAVDGLAVDAATGASQRALRAILAATNVAAVPQWSPFRYPGGKTWLVPTIRRWLRQRPSPPALFLEPFVGGASISLAVAGERLAQRVLMVERDADVAAVWTTILTGDVQALTQRLITFDLVTYTQAVPSAELAPRFTPRPTPRTDSTRAYPASAPVNHPDQLLSRDDACEETTAEAEEIAFQTLLRNRLAFGGILTANAGRLQQGEHGRGLASRWYPATLRRRILAIRHVADHITPITFVEGDGLDILRAYADDPNVAIFLDPPYTAGTEGKRAGKRLYTHWALDHEELFQLAATVRGSILMTYDESADVRALAVRHGFLTRPVRMKTTHHVQTTELLIGRSFDWLEKPA